MLTVEQRAAIGRLWSRKQDQDARGLPKEERHRNLEPASAELIHTLAVGCGARRLLEVGGSSGLSTIALSAAARETGGRLTSIEIEPQRQEEAKQTIGGLGLAENVDFVLGDAGACLPRLGPFDLVLIDCEKDDYIRFFEMLPLASEALVIADNILSHNLTDYVRHVRSKPGIESVTLPVGKGLELSRIVARPR